MFLVCFAEEGTTIATYFSINIPNNKRPFNLSFDLELIAKETALRQNTLVAKSLDAIISTTKFISSSIVKPVFEIAKFNSLGFVLHSLSSSVNSLYL